MNASTMKAIGYRKKSGIWSAEEYVERGTLGAGWVKLDVQFVGICDTDHLIFGAVHPSAIDSIVPGHEISATVAMAGAGVSLKVGTPVVVNPYLTCGTCQPCGRGWSNCCDNLEVIGIHLDGGLRQQILVPEKNVYPALDLDLKTAVMVEVFAVAAHAVRRSQITSPSRALVIGCDSPGLSIASILRDEGYDLTLVDELETHVEMAKANWGFNKVIHANRGDLYPEEGKYDVIFDTTGSNAWCNNAVNSLLAPCGTFIFAGIAGEGFDISADSGATNQASVIFTRNATPEDFEKALDFVKSRPEAVARMITHEMPFSKAFGRTQITGPFPVDMIKIVVRMDIR